MTARLIALAATAIVLAGCGSTSARQTPPALVLGALFSTTGGGAAIGVQQVAGARLAVTQLNDAGGIDEAPLHLLIRDDGTDPIRAKAIVHELVGKSHALGLLGPTLSNVAVSADPVADSLKTPVLAVSNTAKGIVGTCAYPCTWIWRASLGEAVAVPANISAYVGSAHPASAAILNTTPDVLGEEEAKTAAATFEHDGVRVPATVPIPAGTTDLAGYVALALGEKPSALFVGSSFADTIAGVIRAARAQHFTGAILSGNVLNSTTTAKLAGRAGAGARSAVAWIDGNRFPANADFIAAFRRKYGYDPDQFAAQAYTGVLIYADALRRARLAGSSAPVAEQREQLQSALPAVALTTPLGPFRFTDSHDVHQIVWLRALDGRGGSRLTGFCNPNCS